MRGTACLLRDDVSCRTFASCHAVVLCGSCTAKHQHQNKCCHVREEVFTQNWASDSLSLFDAKSQLPSKWCTTLSSSGKLGLLSKWFLRIERRGVDGAVLLRGTSTPILSAHSAWFELNRTQHLVLNQHLCCVCSSLITMQVTMPIFLLLKCSATACAQGRLETMKVVSCTEREALNAKHTAARSFDSHSPRSQAAPAHQHAGLPQSCIHCPQVPGLQHPRDAVQAAIEPSR